MIRQFELVEMVRAYNPNTDEALLNRAYVYGVRAHGGQTRASGEPYFNHPVDVAAILTQLRLDDATIVTALLHDTIEDTDATQQELEGMFGAEIANLVEGVTKLSKLELKAQNASKERAQAENLRKLLVAMAEDPRVLLVKMADRLHNMRTIHHLRPDKRERIARETLEIFAPLAGRMGMQAMREELEDLSFAVLEPEARLSVLRRFVHLRRETGDETVPKLVAALQEVLAAAGVQSDISGREKRPYSIWRKMESKGVSFEQLSDIIAFRVVVDDEEACYRALGAVHRAFVAVPDRFKDYISGPKPNGYRSLHTSVIGPSGARIEIQIRTQQMNEVAETGVAAHWAYKDGRRSANPFAVDPFRWLRELVDQVESGAPLADDPSAFLEEAKREMAGDNIYCFTPRGDVVALPHGAVALDFAYAIHTDLGHTAVGARIDGRQQPLQTKLRTGQTIEILQSEGQSPSPIWRDIVKTGRARAAIRHKLRAAEKTDAAAVGRHVVESAFVRADAALSDKALDAAARKLGYAERDALLSDVGGGRITASQILDAVYPERAGFRSDAHGGALGAVSDADPERQECVSLRAGGGALKLPSAACCRPLPGERVIALREPGQGFRLHAIDCPTLERFEDAMDRWLDVSWAPDAGARAEHAATILLTLRNEPGALGEICMLVGRSGANIEDLAMIDRKPDYFSIRFDLAVRDIQHLTGLLSAIAAQPVTAESRRLRRISAPVEPRPPRTPIEAKAPDPEREAANPG